MTKIKFVIPFDDIQDGEWKLFFPFKTVYHYRQKIKFTPKRGAEMVGNFGKVPDYELPINTLHDDALGVFGYIKSLRIGDYGIEWLPEFNEGAVEKVTSTPRQRLYLMDFRALTAKNMTMLLWESR